MNNILKFEKLNTEPTIYNASTLYLIRNITNNTIKIKLSDKDANIVYENYGCSDITQLTETIVTALKNTPDGLAGINQNGYINCYPYIINKPEIISHINNQVVNSSNILLTSSNFITNIDYDSHDSSSWQIATDANFINIVQEVIDSTLYKTEWTVNGLLNGNYYIRIKHKGLTYGYSDWSDATCINISVNLIPDNEEAILTASDKAASDMFGVSVSISGDGSRVVIGAYGADPSGLTDAGKVYIYSRSGTVWVQEAILMASDPAVYAYFGYSTYISGDGSRAIIGAYGASPSGLSNAGKAYVFSRSGTVWTEEAILTASDKASYDNFGYSVSMSADGGRVIIGAYQADPSGLSSAGKAYIFSRSGTVWTQEAILIASDKASMDYFGISVSISGDGSIVIIGAYGADPSGISFAGKAYIYSRSGTVWTQEAVLTASDKAANDGFGRSVSISIDGSRVIIGAYGASPSGLSSAGKAYIFSRSGTVWTEEAILIASDKAASDNFGRSVTISGDGSRAIIGAYGADPSGISNAGKAYIYSRSGTVWGEEAILMASDTASYDYFGYVVFISGDGSRVIIGAYQADPSGLSNAGKAYIFS